MDIESDIKDKDNAVSLKNVKGDVTFFRMCHLSIKME